VNEDSADVTSWCGLTGSGRLVGSLASKWLQVGLRHEGWCTTMNYADSQPINNTGKFLTAKKLTG